MPDQRSILINQAICSGGAWIQRRSRYGHDLAPLLASHAGRDQRAGTLGCLDNDSAAGDSGDDAVAPGEILRLGAVADRAFGNEQAFSRDLGIEALVLGRVDVVDCAAKLGDGACSQCCGVHLSVNAEGEAGNGDETGFAEPGSDIPRQLATRSGGIAGADNRYGGLGGEGGFAEQGEDGGRGARVRRSGGKSASQLATMRAPNVRVAAIPASTSSTDGAMIGRPRPARRAISGRA